MTRSTILKRLAVCAFTAAATATLSSMAVVAGRADAQLTPGGPGYNAGGNLPSAGLGSPVIQQDTGTTGTRPGNGPGYNSGNGLPLAGGGSVVIQPGGGGQTNPPPVVSGGHTNPPPVVSGGQTNPPPIVSGGHTNPPPVTGGSHNNVPEPISVLGTLTASVFGVRFMKKRKQMQASNSNEQA